MRDRLAILVLSLVPMGVLAQSAYFPAGAFDDSVSDQSKANYYSGELKILDEPSLAILASGLSGESYRFLWLRSLDSPIAIRLDVKADGTGTLTTKIADGQSGFPNTSRKVVENFSRPLTREQVGTFLALVQRTNFWSIATCVDPMDTDPDDGSQWVIEGAKAGKYHAVTRWSPDVNRSAGSAAVLELGMTLASDLARLKIPKDKMY